MAITGTILAVASVASTAASIDNSKRAARRQKRANEIRTNAQMGQDRQARIQSTREQRIRRARVLQLSENTGSAGSSQMFGAIGGAQTITSAAEGQRTGMAINNIAISDLNQQAADYQGKAQMFNAIAQLSMQGASMAMASPKPVPTT